MKKINWGILGAATIAVEKVIPAMQNGNYTHVAAIASRDLGKAQRVAEKYNIARAWGSYEELLNDTEISAIYIPLPNNLHVEWSIRALQAGKHVLCEKPIGLTAAESETLLKASMQFPDLKIMEAFMYRFHPQWTRVKEMIRSGIIGKLHMIDSHFSFFDDDPRSIVNKKGLGGGSLLDIGCYSTSLSRYLFDEEPERVLGHMDIDPRYMIDRTTCGIMTFGEGRISKFTSATQQSEYQKVTLLGNSGIIEMETPFIVETNEEAVINVHTGSKKKKILIEKCDQYTLQADLFSKCIIDDKSVPIPIKDAIKNMHVIDSITQSATLDTWINLK